MYKTAFLAGQRYYLTSILNVPVKDNKRIFGAFYTFLTK